MKHGMSRTRLYRVWSGMKTRCYNPVDKNYANYGARGIVVCEEWKSDFLAFYGWAMASGYNPGAARGECTLERINNEGPYSPDNCKWATIKEQENNRRNNIRIRLPEKENTLSQYCEEQGCNYAAELKMYHRRNSGVRPMATYNEHRKQKKTSAMKHLAMLMKNNPTWTNAKIAAEMRISVRTIQRMKREMQMMPG